MALCISLPNEILEIILVYSLYSNGSSHETPSPSSLSHLAQTCRHFRVYIYQSEDNHLWQLLFLASFDKPLEPRAWIKPLIEKDNTIDLIQMDWKSEFIKLFSARRIINQLHSSSPYKHSTHATTSSKSQSPIGRIEIVEALRAIRNALYSLPPIQAPAMFTREMDTAATEAFRAVWSPFASLYRNEYPGWNAPEEIQRLEGLPSYFDPAKFHLPIESPPSSLQPTLHGSKTLKWVELILSPFYPQKLLESHFLCRQLEYQDDDILADQCLNIAFGPGRELWMEERRLISEIIFLRGAGRIPITDFTSQHAENLYISSTQFNDYYGTPGSSVVNTILASNFGPPRACSLARAYIQARRNVYNLGYLIWERAWGPFEIICDLKAEYESIDKSRLTRAVKKRRREHKAEVIPAEGLIEPTVDRANNYVDESTHSTSSSEYPDPLTSNFNALDSPPNPHKVIPDYTFLASARLVMEFNMRGLVCDDEEPDTTWFTMQDEKEIGGLGWPPGSLGLEMLRAGSAVGYTEIYSGRYRAVNKDGEEEDGDGRSSEGASCISENNVPGWDWAGVTGEWRRCVCFIDYGQLLNFDVRIPPQEQLGLTKLIFDSKGELDNHFPPRLTSGHAFPVPFEEDRPLDDINIFSMSLKVIGYSAPPELSEHNTADHPSDSLLAYTLPIIHFEGTSRGVDANLNEARKVTGTVRMLECGRVRWSSKTWAQGGEKPEFMSENIQVGGIGSAMGILGLWSAVDNEFIRPIGPIWSWKVR